MSDTVADPDRDAMYRTFEAAPGDLTGYGVMADRLDELGYAALAYAFRWMSRRGKWPHRRENYSDPVKRAKGRKVPAKFRWAWYGELAFSGNSGMVRIVWPEVAIKPHSLPPLLLTGEQKVYASHQSAVMDLAKRLARLKDVYDLDAKGGRLI